MFLGAFRGGGQSRGGLPQPLLLRVCAGESGAPGKEGGKEGGREGGMDAGMLPGGGREGGRGGAGRAARRRGGGVQQTRAVWGWPRAPRPAAGGAPGPGRPGPVPGTAAPAAREVILGCKFYPG